jgi:glycosyltransferase involved in cell wall biosynthesis
MLAFRNSKMYFVREPLVSVVIINWNYARYVADAIGSVKDQTYRNVECLVIDNGSSDRSADIIDAAIDGHAQFTLHRLPKNLGQLGAAIWSFDRLRGEFVTYLDADDVLNLQGDEPELDVDQARDEQGFRVAIEALTRRSLEAGIAGFDYKAVVSDEWRRTNVYAQSQAGYAVASITQPYRVAGTLTEQIFVARHAIWSRRSDCWQCDRRNVNGVFYL